MEAIQGGAVSVAGFRQKTRNNGFTLLELLIALAITGSVVALIFAGFGAIGRSEQRSHDALDRTVRMMSVQQWLHRKFDTLRGLSKSMAGGYVLFFNGNAAGAMWVAPLPERGVAGGLHVLRLTPFRHENGRVDLTLEALPYDGVLMELDWTRAKREVLLSDVRTLQWFYQGGQSGVWGQSWDSSQSSYPSRIRIEIADAKGAWVPMLFTLPRAR